MSEITFHRIESAMRMYGHSRYEVRQDDAFIGEVFTFNTERYNSTVRWMAQRVDGTLFGWLTPYRTRKAAAECLPENGA